MTAPERRDALLVGCGDLGQRIGHRLAAGGGRRVWGLRRQAHQVPAPLLGLAADLTREAPTLPPELDLEFLVVALTTRPRTADAYRATYVDGLGRALDALEAAGQRPRRAVLVSSTAVYGELGPEPLTDEATTPAPGDGPARVLLEAEELFLARLGDAPESGGSTVLRLSGLYDGSSTRLLDRVRAGSITDPARWTNRIHRDDAADAVVHLLTRDEEPATHYVGTDDEPARLGEVAAYLAGLDRPTGAPRPPAAGPGPGHGKRLSNTRLRATGWVPQYPTFRDGYRDLG